MHNAQTMYLNSLDKLGCLERVGIHNVSRVHSSGEYTLNFSFAGTVKATTK